MQTKRMLSPVVAVEGVNDDPETYVKTTLKPGTEMSDP